MTAITDESSPALASDEPQAGLMPGSVAELQYQCQALAERLPGRDPDSDQANADADTGSNSAARELPTFYYLDNFDSLLQQVMDRYDDLLQPEERQQLIAIQQLPQMARGWFVRLHGRKGQRFRLDKLAYAELCPLEDVLDQLLTASLVVCHSPQALPLSSWAGLYNKQEWLALLQASGDLPAGAKSWKRPQLDAWLEDQALNSPGGLPPPIPASRIVSKLAAVEDTLQRVRLLFFGNLQQSLTDFVLSDLGVFRYQGVDIGAARAFCSRSRLDRHLQYYACLPEDPDWLRSASADDLEQFSRALPDDPDDPVLSRRVGRQRLRAARQLERLGQADTALAVYRLTSAAGSRERQVRLLAHNQPEQALRVCQAIWQQPLNDEEIRFVESFAPRLAKKHRLPCDWLQSLPGWQQCSDDLTDDEQQQLVAGTTIESVALQRLREQGLDAFYVENGLLGAVFGLTFWEVVFAPIAGAFFHPYQVRPDDLYEEDFQARRQPLIDQALARVSLNDWPEQLLHTIENRFGTANPFVAWGLVKSMLANGCLARALTHIPPDHWRALFIRLLGDLKRRRTGLPDLIAFDEAGGYQWIEIKGPGDTLQPNQKSWLGFFEQQGMPARVWYLTRPTG